MARVPLLDPDQNPSLDALAARIRGERRGSLLNLYRALFHSPRLAETWFDHFNAVRWQTGLPGRLREIVIIRVGYLNDAAYILRQHVPKLAQDEGLSATECAELGNWTESDAFDPAERAALAYTDAMTRDVAVADAVFEALRPHFVVAEIVELTVLVGSYNLHSRVLRALEVDLEPA